MTDLLDLVCVDYAPDLVAELWGNPHWNHGCKFSLAVSNIGLVYCADCASQVGAVPRSLAGLTLGKGGASRRWLNHEEIEAAWKAGGKDK